LRGAKVTFKNDGDEYDFIGKFGRGAWSEDEICKAFIKKDQDVIVEIASGYGAFDY